MRKTMLTLLALVVVAIATILVLAAIRPDSFRVERQLLIKAPANVLFGHINDLARWKVWSPYEEKDPAMKRTMTGAASGKGAIYAWEGNNQVGSGRMEITDSTEPSRVVIQLDFFKPFEAHNTAEFTLVPQDGGTLVTWAMFGPAPLLNKIMGLVFNLDKMVGTDFAKGLEKLKALAEKGG